MTNPWRSLSPRAKTYVAVGLALFLLLSAFTWGARGVNWVSSKVFRVGNLILTKDMQKDLDDAQKGKKAVAETLTQLAADKQALADSKEDYEEEKRKRLALEQILADRRKSVDEKLRAYDEAVKRAPTVHIDPEPLTEQCARAAELGLKLAICP